MKRWSAYNMDLNEYFQHFLGCVITARTNSLIRTAMQMPWRSQQLKRLETLSKRSGALVASKFGRLAHPNFHSDPYFGTFQLCEILFSRFQRDTKASADLQRLATAVIILNSRATERATTKQGESNI